MTEKSATTDKNALFEESVGYLKQSLALSVRSQERVGFRVRILIRAVMIGLVMTLVSIFFLIYLLTNQVEALSDTLDVITDEAIEIRSSMDNIHVVLMSFDNQMEAMPPMNQSVAKIKTDIHMTSSGMKRITGDVQTMSIELSGLQAAITGLSNNITQLDYTLLRVNKDMKDTTKPLRRFNQMNPMNYVP